MAQEELVNADTEVATKINAIQENEMKNEYTSKIGEITEINKEGDYYSILVGTPLDGVRYIVDNSQMIIDAKTLGFLQPSELKEGMEITVVVSKNAPMTMSLPPMISDQVAIIVNSSERFVNMSYFDETLVNEENTLALNIERGAYIINTTGEKRIFTEDDIKNNSVVVIYTSSTRSIPAQTTPSMVLILPNNEVAKEIEEPRMMESEVVQYKSVRDVAMECGYDVTWDNETKSVTLVKGENVIVLTVGQAECIYNGSIKVLKEIVKMENQKVYVSSDLDELL